MNLNRKSTSIIAGVMAAVALAFSALLTQYNIDYDMKISYDYEIHQSGDYVSNMVVSVPESQYSEELPLSRCVLVLNDQKVTEGFFSSEHKASLISIPLVFSDLGNLYLEGYYKDEVIALGKFEGEKLVWYYNKARVSDIREAIIASQTGEVSEDE